MLFFLISFSFVAVQSYDMSAAAHMRRLVSIAVVGRIVAPYLLQFTSSLLLLLIELLRTM